mmetsp:Transcript_31108/g.72407  ORF Transcript_31108/g.72407 Transcript_31108/m.72407 type:complete len:275 (+) Transcript_31108:262-1086(+)
MDATVLRASPCAVDAVCVSCGGVGHPSSRHLIRSASLAVSAPGDNAATLLKSPWKLKDFSEKTPNGMIFPLKLCGMLTVPRGKSSCGAKEPALTSSKMLLTVRELPYLSRSRCLNSSTSAFDCAGAGCGLGVGEGFATGWAGGSSGDLWAGSLGGFGGTLGGVSGGLAATEGGAWRSRGAPKLPESEASSMEGSCRSGLGMRSAAAALGGEGADAEADPNELRPCSHPLDHCGGAGPAEEARALDAELGLAMPRLRSEGLSRSGPEADAGLEGG